jgi:hypothetical protein
MLNHSLKEEYYMKLKLKEDVFEEIVNDLKKVNSFTILND